MSQSYRWRGGEEGWLRFGADCPVQIVMIEPLFEEANRCRRLVVGVLRRLATRGIGSVLPDLPGTGESMSEIATITLTDWQDAVAAVVEAVRPTVMASMRGGALLDSPPGGSSQWRFAPETGARIVRDLRRTRLATLEGATPLYAGHALSDRFLDMLATAAPAASSRLRTLRLDSDTAEADARFDGAPLWRRAEPGEDAALAAWLADDLHDWVQLCANG